MTERERLLRRISAIDFAIYELHLYLDTHPDSSHMLKKLRQYQEKSTELKKIFEQKFGPLTIKNEEENNWEWVANPWPWENEEECGCYVDI